MSGIDPDDGIALAEVAEVDMPPKDALKKFQEATVDNECTRQLFRVNRIDGVANLRRDIIGIYKNPKTNLRAIPRVVFEKEDGVGNGPRREFLQCAMKTVEEGILSTGRSGKAMPFFEGQQDHRLPVHDQSLRLTGSFKSIGRIIGHCSLHGGPGLHGISSAAMDYWMRKDSDESFHIVLDDIPDIDLRDHISQVCFSISLTAILMSSISSLRIILLVVVGQQKQVRLKNFKRNYKVNICMCL